MIDQGVFRNEWALLCERFRMMGQREPSQPMMRRYFEYLNDRMDTLEFQSAAARIYVEAEFFPRPVDFLPSQENQAALQWEKIYGLLPNSVSPLDSLDPIAKRVVRMMGGLFQIGSDIKALEFRRKAFMDLYAGIGESSRLEYQITGEGRKLINAAMDGRELSGAP